MRAQRAQHVLAAIALCAASGCGAKTPLRLYDGGPDAYQRPDEDTRIDASRRDVPPGTDVPFVPIDADPGFCTPEAFRIERRAGEVMFVIDRSGSMADPFDTRVGPRSRWIAMGDEVAAALQPFQRTIAMGATFFPVEQGPGASDCTVPRVPDVLPAASNALPIIRILGATSPAGSTPTFLALQMTSDFLASRARPGVSRFMMLATDGSPNCNPGGSIGDEVDPSLRVLETSARRGIPTYVIGLDDPNDPQLANALHRMAMAGGRPRLGGGVAYYSVRRTGEITQAFEAIQRAISRCVIATLPAPRQPDLVQLAFDGAVLPRDRSRNDGWDFTDAPTGEITLFGPTCDRVAGIDGTFSAEVVCAGGR